MKKLFYSIALLLIAASCSKQNANDALTVKAVIPVTVEIGSPDSPETKITETTSDKVHSFQWDANDAFQLFVYKAGIAKDEEIVKNTPETGNFFDCGAFTTSEGGASALFSGSFPAGIPSSCTRTYCIFPAKDNLVINAKASDTNKISIEGMNIAPEQDGTGFKYAHFAAVDGTLEFDAEGNPSFKNAPTFKLSNGVVHMTLNPSLDVRKICLVSEYNDGVKQYLAGDIRYATNSTGDNSAGTSNKITVYNGGSVLDDVYIVMRHTVGNGTYGYCKFQFAFFNGDGNVAIKTLTLKNGDDYVNVSSGQIISLGNIESLSFKTPESYTKTISWVTSTAKPYVCTITAVDGATEAKGFPYTNSGTAASITKLTWGKDGETITPTGSACYYYKNEHEFMFWGALDGTVKTRVAVGGYASASFYHHPAAYNYIRMSAAYISIPAQPGYKLSHVSATGGNSASRDSFCISTVKTTPSESKCLTGAYNVNFGKPNAVDIDITDAWSNTTYYQVLAADRLLLNFTWTFVPATL